jgi:hypothetical protein
MADTGYQELGERESTTDPSAYEPPTLTTIGSLDELTTAQAPVSPPQDLSLPLD